MLPSIDLGDTLARIAATPYRAEEGPTATVAPPTFSTAALVKMRSVLRVGIRFDAPPLASVNEEGELIGLDVDIARELARRWLGSPRNVEFVQVTSNSALRRIQNREVDLALGGLIHSRPAETYADFSFSYLEDGEALLIRAGAIADLPSLAQRTVTYIDTTSLPAAGRMQAANNMTVTLQSAPSYAAAIQSLLDGETDAVIGRWRRLRAEAAQNGALAVLAVLERQPVAIMLPQNDSDWADLVNVTLSALINDGFYADAYQRWFGQPAPPVTPLPGQIDLQLAALPDFIAPRGVYERLRTTNSVRIGFNAQSDPLATLDANGQPIGYL
ncbi:MAG: transporter substrate-binding domain-containing protein, partial [Anaerolineae bacterium]|nr:transporter substrate-binding domain-containing protein [Thermoflexales bacterium]MDW8407747.1 transporter substrate-binding domain-containing protein [Anaerolineae bacterium]